MYVGGSSPPGWTYVPCGTGTMYPGAPPGPMIVAPPRPPGIGLMSVVDCPGPTIVVPPIGFGRMIVVPWFGVPCSQPPAADYGGKEAIDV